MHDFDAPQRQTQTELLDEGTGSFTLRGETFHIRRVVPFAVLRKITSITADSDNTDVYETFETSILSLLATEDDRERFLKVLYDTTSEFPVTYQDVLDVNRWVIEEATSRPPTQPGSSSESPSTNGTASTGTSSTEPAEG